MVVSSTRNLDAMRHTFITQTLSSWENIELFANQNGFKRVLSYPTRVYISANWNSRDIKIITNSFGVVENIQHRKVRWFSATFKKFQSSSCQDIRAYLETQQELDQDENCLNSLKKYFEDRSIFHPDFVELINQHKTDVDELPSNPLLNEFVRQNWQFFHMRIVKYLAMYQNEAGDILEYIQVFNAAYGSDCNFDWQGKHNELQIQMNVNERTNEDLCRNAYDTSLKLFSFLSS